MKRPYFAAILSSAILLVPSVSSAALLSDNFDSDTSANYNVLLFTPAADEVTFAFDYGALGIPEAPNSTGPETKTGVLMRANNNPNTAVPGANSAVQIAPIGLAPSLAGKDYDLTYDLWMNYHGPAPLGGTGSTQAFLVGVGFDDAAAMNIGTSNGTYFSITGDGGSGTDIRSFTNDGFNAAGINQGPSNNSSDPYYAGIFPGGIDVGSLPVQGGTSNQTGTSAQGQMAFEWHEVRVEVRGSQVDFYVDDLLIASDPNADVTGNVMLGYGDYFSGKASDPAWLFSVTDNLAVNVIPEPSTALLGGLLLGAAGLIRRRKA